MKPSDSFEYDPEIRKQVRFEWGRVEPVLYLDRVGREPERGIEEEPVEIRPPSSLPVWGDEGHRHLLAKYFPEQPRYACDWREAVGVLALEREQESIDGYCRRVGVPRHIPG